jgi:coenzyme PQQ precursor peptide PqqA
MWQKPTFEIVDVGAEVTAYLYTDETESAKESESDEQAQS